MPRANNESDNISAGEKNTPSHRKRHDWPSVSHQGGETPFETTSDAALRESVVILTLTVYKQTSLFNIGTFHYRLTATLKFERRQTH